MQYAPRLLTRLTLALPLLPLLVTAVWLMPSSRPTPASAARTVPVTKPAAGTHQGLHLQFAASHPPALTAYSLQATSAVSSGRTITVNTTADVIAADGRCSLREALMAANGNRKVNECSSGGIGMDTIKFNLSAGTPTITLNSPLPLVTEPVQILGNTGASARVELNGANVGMADGLTLAAGSSGSIIRNLVINRFNGAGIYIQSDGNTVEGCLIGTDAAGHAVAGNYFSGIEIENSANNTIGGISPGDGNVIAGNGEAGVLISGAGATGNFIQGNFIGTDITGTTAVPNALSGVIINGAAGNTVGGTYLGARNIISGNGESGVFVNGATATGNAILGNFIGTDVTGALALGNVIRGISLVDAPNNRVGGTDAGAGNVIAANGGAGIGIFGNISSGNNSPSSTATGNRVEGNLIGTNAAGDARLGNDDFGVVIENAPNNRIGGSSTASRNVISGNNEAGVIITGAASIGNVIAGNFIGTNAAGTAAIANAGGVAIDSASGNTVGGADAGARNVISGNAGDGVVIGGGGQNLVQNNLIGPGADGRSDLGNALNGVMILESVGNTVGGMTPGTGNVIAFNRQVGVLIAPVFRASANNAINGNAIFANGGGAIDLSLNPHDPFSDGPTANDAGDADAGTNGLQNFPVINSVTSTGTVQGSLDSLPAFTAYPVRVEFFAAAACDTSGRGLGEVYLGATTLAAPGDFTARITPVPGKPFISATATDANGNTSEFSPCRKINTPPAAIALAITQASGSFMRRLIATVSDPDQPPILLSALVSPLGGSGVTLANVSVNAAGEVFADVTASCSAINSTFLLIVRDELGESTTAQLTVNVSPALPPTLGVYANQVVGQGASFIVTPTARPADDGAVNSVSVSVSPGFTGQFRVSPTTGAVAISNAGPPGNYTITVTAVDNCGLSVSRSFQLAVDKVTTAFADSVACLTKGSTVTVETQITHYGQSVTNASLTASLPAQLSFVTGSCGATPAVGACDAGTAQQVSWSGPINPGETVTVRYQAQIISDLPNGSELAVNSFAYFDGGASVSYDTTQKVGCEDEPGAPLAAANRFSDDKPGSVLFFPVYASSYDAPQRENTRLNLTNTDKERPARVHVFFVNSAGNVADSFLCLTPLQTATLLASDYDPGVRGYIVAVAVDEQGVPIKFNKLIGSEYVKLASGHEANLAAVSFAALSDTPAVSSPSAGLAVLKFDGVNYNTAPRTLALTNLPSPADGNETLLIVSRFGGDLTGQSVGTLGDLAGMLFDAGGSAYSFSFSVSERLLVRTLSDAFPRTQPRWTAALTSGKSGWLRFGSKTDTSIIGVSINRATNAAAYSQGHNLHALDLTTTATLTIPLVRPPCP